MLTQERAREGPGEEEEEEEDGAFSEDLLGTHTIRKAYSGARLLVTRNRPLHRRACLPAWWQFVYLAAKRFDTYRLSPPRVPPWVGKPSAWWRAQTIRWVDQGCLACLPYDAHRAAY